MRRESYDIWYEALVIMGIQAIVTFPISVELEHVGQLKIMFCCCCLICMCSYRASSRRSHAFASMRVCSVLAPAMSAGASSAWLHLGALQLARCIRILILFNYLYNSIENQSSGRIITSSPHLTSHHITSHHIQCKIKFTALTCFWSL